MPYAQRENSSRDREILILGSAGCQPVLFGSLPKSFFEIPAGI
jgi:hypothetical protein